MMRLTRSRVTDVSLLLVVLASICLMVGWIVPGLLMLAVSCVCTLVVLWQRR
jgi:uncharacterized membrane protein